MKKIILVGEGHSAINSFIRLIINLNVVAVISQEKNVKLKTICEEKNICIYDDINSCQNIEADIMLMISYGKILNKEIIERFDVINVHYGLLPKYRGLHTVCWALINGEEETGFTVHKVDEKIDNGDIIYQKKINIHKDDNIKTIMDKLDFDLANTIVEIIKDYQDNKLILKKQSLTEATYFAKRNMTDCYINWNQNSEEIINFIRALVDPYPGAFTIYNNKKIKILEAEIFNDINYKEIPGHVVGVIKGKGIIVKTQDSSLLIKKVIVEEDAIDADKFFVKPGARLGINLEKIYIEKLFNI